MSTNYWEDDPLVTVSDYSKLSWLAICKLADKYGKDVGVMLAKYKVAGIVAKQFFNSYNTIYQKIKNDLPADFDESFFDLMKCSYKLATLGIYLLDIVELDEGLSRADPDYDCVECLYKGKNVSMKDYVNLRYGTDYVKIIELVI